MGDVMMLLLNAPLSTFTRRFRIDTSFTLLILAITGLIYSMDDMGSFRKELHKFLL